LKDSNQPQTTRVSMSEANDQEKKAGMVAIIGRPNAGKSTLMNRVIGSRLSIVTRKAQTTREMVRGILTEEEKGQMVFLDTPGIHRAKRGGINESMVFAAAQALEAPDAVWYLVDPQSAPEHEKLVLEALQKAPRGCPIFVILTKADLQKDAEPSVVGDQVAKELKSLGFERVETIKLSARRNKGVSELLEKTWETLPIGHALYPDPDQLSDRPVRFFVAEMVREQVFRCLGDELPYSCAVRVENFEDGPKLVRIEAEIVVERDSQKGMVIGKGGQKIKEIGAAARAEIQKWLDKKVFLQTRLKVQKNWTKNPSVLEDMGYALPKRSEGGARASH
jgi:GTP-binding protein Era